MHHGESACIRPIFCDCKGALRGVTHLKNRIESDLRDPRMPVLPLVNGKDRISCDGNGVVEEATKGARWMPRHWRPKKDAAQLR